MNDEVLNNDIPVEVLLKHAVRERDHYKAKLDELKEYAHALEAKLKKQEEFIGECSDVLNKAFILKNTAKKLSIMMKHIRSQAQQGIDLYDQIKKETK